jgi:hypothetical protein
MTNFGIGKRDGRKEEEGKEKGEKEGGEGRHWEMGVVWERAAGILGILGVLGILGILGVFWAFIPRERRLEDFCVIFV